MPGRVRATEENVGASTFKVLLQGYRKGSVLVFFGGATGVLGNSANWREVIPNRGLSEANRLPACDSQIEKRESIRIDFFPRH
jgi:hypothetical protein